MFVAFLVLVVITFVATLTSLLFVVEAWLNRSGDHEVNLED